MNTVTPSTVYRGPADLVTNGTAPGARAQLLSEINGRSTYALVLVPVHLRTTPVEFGFFRGVPNDQTDCS